MTKSNNEWVPEVGQVVMASWVGDDGGLMDTAVEVSAYRGDKAWVTCCGLDKVFHLTDIKFRPVKTEAEKRRDELTGRLWNDLDKFYEGTDRTTSYETARFLINAGWIKSQPLTDDVIDSVMRHAKFSLTTYRDFAKAIEAYIRGES